MIAIMTPNRIVIDTPNLRLQAAGKEVVKCKHGTKPIKPTSAGEPQ
jgi:hypothetical protein